MRLFRTQRLVYEWWSRTLSNPEKHNRLYTLYTLTLPRRPQEMSVLPLSIASLTLDYNCHYDRLPQSAIRNRNFIIIPYCVAWRYYVSTEDFHDIVKYYRTNSGAITAAMAILNTVDLDLTWNFEYTMNVSVETNNYMLVQHILQKTFSKGHIDSLKRLILKACKSNSGQDIFHALITRYKVTTKKDTSHILSHSLIIASIHDSWEIIDYLVLKCGVSPCFRNSRALLLACIHNNNRSVRLLLSFGADPRAHEKRAIRAAKRTGGDVLKTMKSFLAL